MAVFSDRLTQVPTGLQGRDAQVGADHVIAVLKDIEQIATDTLGKLSEDNERSRKRLHGATVAAAAFGSDPRGKAMAQSTESAHEVFLTTVSELQNVLEQYRDNLLAVVQEYQDADDASAELVLRRARERNLSTGGTESLDHAEDQSVQQQQAEESQQPPGETPPPGTEPATEQGDTTPGTER